METDVLLALLLITGLAAVIPILAKRLDRFGIPIVVYEILAGMIIGSSGFNLIEPSTILTFLAEFGFAFLMFLSGLELDYRLLNPNYLAKNMGSRWTRALPLGVFIFLGTLVLAFVAAAFLAPEGASSNPILLGLILSTTSLGVVVPVLKERGLTATHFGQYILVTASIADFATLLLLSTVIAVLSQGLTLDLLLIPTLLLIFILVGRLSLRVSQGSRLQIALDSLSSATSQLRVRLAFAFMVAWVVLAEAFGVEVILGAFLAGAIAGLISGNEDHGERDKLDAIGYGFFIPIFFIMVGAQFNLQVILESTNGLLLLAWLMVVAFTVKIVPALLLKLRFTWKQTLGGGLLLSSRLSLIIAASAIALSMGLIGETTNSAIIMLSIITVAISPFLFSRVYPRVEEKTRSGIIVAGHDQLTEYIIRRLRHSEENITAICSDPSRTDSLKDLGATIVTSDDGFDLALEEAGAINSRVLLDLSTDPAETKEICQLGRTKYEIPLVVSRISEVELITELKQIGVKVVQPELATAMALEGAILYPTAFDVLIHQTENIEVSEILVSNPRLTGVRLGNIALPGDVLVLSLQRESTILIPNGDTILRHNDRLGLIGSPDCVGDAVDMLRG